MLDGSERAPLGTVGWVMLLLGVAAPGAIAVVAAFVPSLGWVRGPAWATGFVGTLVLAGGGLLLIAAAAGFVRRRTWAWWIVGSWGLLCAFELVRGAASEPLTVTVSVPQLIAAALLAIVWKSRARFDVSFGRSIR